MKYQRLQKTGSFRSWRTIVNLWSVVFFTAIIYDFFTENSLAHEDVILAISAIYCAALAIYSAEKEFRRWHHMHASIHPGEVYVILWTILMVFIIAGNIAFMPGYHIPAEVSASYVAAITILALTRESKNYYKRRHKG